MLFSWAKHLTCSLHSDLFKHRDIEIDTNKLLGEHGGTGIPGPLRVKAGQGRGVEDEVLSMIHNDFKDI